MDYVKWSLSVLLIFLFVFLMFLFEGCNYPVPKQQEAICTTDTDCGSKEGY